MTQIETPTSSQPRFLTIGGTGKTGRRVTQALRQRGLPVRVGSRTAEIPFDWHDRTTWEPALSDVRKIYAVYYPDLAVPEAAEAIRSLAEIASHCGVEHMVLLSGRGEEGAQAAERQLQTSGLAWTIVRASWFAQNFSEGFLADQVRHGHVSLPVGGVREPFVDADDIADVVVAALTEEGHEGKLYEVTGPQLLTFGEAVSRIAEVSKKDIRYVQISPEAFADGLRNHGAPAELVRLLTFLFTEVLDGRNESTTDGVQRALGRPPRSFREYAQRAAATGAWTAAEVA
ncbi:MAG: NAD(P)H-binding protein [Thermoanaerobaculia bacterium]|nr:NAD(P)H-binding protein [Thermoanaerobaculia bacterium]